MLLSTGLRFEYRAIAVFGERRALHFSSSLIDTDHILRSFLACRIEWMGKDFVYVSGRKRAVGEMNGKSANLNNCLSQIYPPGIYIPASELVCIFDADQVCLTSNFEHQYHEVHRLCRGLWTHGVQIDYHVCKKCLVSRTNTASCCSYLKPSTHSKTSISWAGKLSQLTTTVFCIIQ